MISIKRDDNRWVSILGWVAGVLLVVSPAPAIGKGFVPDSPGLSLRLDPDEMQPVLTRAPDVPAPAGIAVNQQSAVAALPFDDSTRRALEKLRDTWFRRQRAWGRFVPAPSVHPRIRTAA